MSTKIYYARRVLLEDLNALIDDVHEQMFKLVTKRVSMLTKTVLLPDDWKKDKQPPDWELCELHARFTEVMKQTKLAGASHLRDPLCDIECGLNLWIYKRRAYIIPTGEEWILKAIRWPIYAEDYCYWNNVDAPEDVTAAAWRARGRTWDQVNCGTGTADHNARRLYHDVIDMRFQAHVEFDLWQRLHHGFKSRLGKRQKKKVQA